MRLERKTTVIIAILAALALVVPLAVAMGSEDIAADDEPRVIDGNVVVYEGETFDLYGAMVINANSTITFKSGSIIAMDYVSDFSISGPEAISIFIEEGAILKVRSNEETSDMELPACSFGVSGKLSYTAVLDMTQQPLFTEFTISATDGTVVYTEMGRFAFKETDLTFRIYAYMDPDAVIDLIFDGKFLDVAAKLDVIMILDTDGISYYLGDLLVATLAETHDNIVSLGITTPAYLVDGERNDKLTATLESLINMDLEVMGTEYTLFERTNLELGFDNIDEDTSLLDFISWKDVVFYEKGTAQISLEVDAIAEEGAFIDDLVIGAEYNSDGQKSTGKANMSFASLDVETEEISLKVGESSVSFEYDLDYGSILQMLSVGNILQVVDFVKNKYDPDLNYVSFYDLVYDFFLAYYGEDAAAQAEESTDELVEQLGPMPVMVLGVLCQYIFKCYTDATANVLEHFEAVRASLPEQVPPDFEAYLKGCIEDVELIVLGFTGFEAPSFSNAHQVDIGAIALVAGDTVFNCGGLSMALTTGAEPIMKFDLESATLETGYGEGKVVIATPKITQESEYTIEGGVVMETSIDGPFTVSYAHDQTVYIVSIGDIDYEDKTTVNDGELAFDGSCTLKDIVVDAGSQGFVSVKKAVFTMEADVTMEEVEVSIPPMNMEGIIEFLKSLPIDAQAEFTSDIEGLYMIASFNGRDVNAVDVKESASVTVTYKDGVPYAESEGTLSGIIEFGEYKARLDGLKYTAETNDNGQIDITLKGDVGVQTYNAGIVSQSAVAKNAELKGTYDMTDGFTLVSFTGSVELIDRGIAMKFESPVLKDGVLSYGNVTISGTTSIPAHQDGLVSVTGNVKNVRIAISDGDFGFDSAELTATMANDATVKISATPISQEFVVSGDVYYYKITEADYLFANLVLNDENVDTVKISGDGRLIVPEIDFTLDSGQGAAYMDYGYLTVGENQIDVFFVGAFLKVVDLDRSTMTIEAKEGYVLDPDSHDGFQIVGSTVVIDQDIWAAGGDIATFAVPNTFTLTIDGEENQVSYMRMFTKTYSTVNKPLCLIDSERYAYGYFDGNDWTFVYNILGDLELTTVYRTNITDVQSYNKVDDDSFVFVFPAEFDYIDVEDKDGLLFTFDSDDYSVGETVRVSAEKTSYNGKVAYEVLTSGPVVVSIPVKDQSTTLYCLINGAPFEVQNSVVRGTDGYLLVAQIQEEALYYITEDTVNPEPPSPEKGKDNTLLYAGAAAVIIVVVLGAAFFFVKKKN